MKNILGSIRQVRATAGPAATLMFVSVLLAVLVSLARAQSDPTTPVTPGTVVQRLTPGEVFTFTFAWSAPGEAFHAYLPGLDLQRVPLRFDAERGAYVGTLTLPWFAPDRGWVTLRIVGEGLSVDHPLELGEVDAS